MIYITPNENKTWKVKMLGKDFFSSRFESKSAALNFASRMARNNKLDLVVRRPDGIFQFKKQI